MPRQAAPTPPPFVPIGNKAKWAILLDYIESLDENEVATKDEIAEECSITEERVSALINDLNDKIYDDGKRVGFDRERKGYRFLTPEEALTESVVARPLRARRQMTQGKRAATATAANPNASPLIRQKAVDALVHHATVQSAMEKGKRKLNKLRPELPVVPPDVEDDD